MVRRYAMMLATLFALALCAGRALALDPATPFDDYLISAWDLQRGLPQISVISITQDRAGFLWIGTQNGVARFDGKDIKSLLRMSDGRDISMAQAAWAAPDGDVWFGTVTGLVREHDSRLLALGGPSVNAISGGIDGRPLLATAAGVGSWTAQGFRAMPGLRGPFFSLLQRPDGFWAGGLDRLCRQRNGTVTCQPLPGTSDSRVTALAEHRGDLWVGTSRGLLHRVDGRLQPAGLDPDLDSSTIETMLDDRAGNLWIGTLQALYRLRPNGALDRIGSHPLGSPPWVDTLFEDHEGNLWLGTRTHGLFRITDSPAQRYGRQPDGQFPLIWTVARAPDGQIVLGSGKGVLAVHGPAVTTLVPASALPNPSAYTLFYDHAGRLWIGTRGGVAILATGKIETPPALAALTAWQINVIREAPVGSYWIGTQGGLYRYRAGVLRRFGAAPGSAAASIRAIAPLADGRLWVGTGDGLFELDGMRWSRPAWSLPLRGIFVTAIKPLRRGEWLITSADAGIFLLADGRLQRYGTANGLPGNNAWDFNVVGDQVYVPGIDGVWRLPLSDFPAAGSDPATVRFNALRVVGEEGDGLDVNRMRCCNGAGGARSLVVGSAIWYPTTAGAVRLDTTAIRAPQTVTAPLIDAIIHRGQDSLPDGTHVLSDNQRDLDIRYTLPYLRDPGGLRFRYRLSGYDSTWSDPTVRRTAYFTHLPPGHYVFEVQARYGGGEWGPLGTLPLVVTPHWYERDVVRVLGALALFCALWLLLHWRLRRQQTIRLRLERVIAERTEELRRSNERLREANLTLRADSTTDALTGLGNRRQLLTRLPGLLSDDESVAVLLLDLDHFKAVNDRHGHAVGDRVLSELGELLARAKRPGDLALRWGGEEFLLLLRGVDGTQAYEVAERLRQTILAHVFSANAQAIRLTCSIGYSLHPLLPGSSARDFERVLELADIAMYRVKHSGRNGCAGLIAGPAADATLQQPGVAARIDALVAAGALVWIERPR